MSTGQLIVTIAFVGLLGALHLAFRAAREPAGTTALTAPGAALRRFPLAPVLVVAAFAALAVAAAALIVSIVNDEETTAPMTRATTAPRTTAPPPPQPPPPAPAPAPLQTPAGTTRVARVVTDANGSLAIGRNRVGGRPRVLKRETGVYAIEVPGLSVQMRRRAAIRVRPTEGGTRVTARRNGPTAEFVVFSRDQTGNFADRPFEFAVYLPTAAVEGAAGEEDDAEPQLPPTR